MDRRPLLLASLLKDRAALAELVLVAFLLALSVNLMATALPVVFGWRPLTTLALAVLVSLLSAGFFLRRLHKQLTRHEVLQGFFVYHRGQNRVLEIPRYEFGENLHSYLKAAFAENPAYESLWQKEPLGWLFARDKAQQGRPKARPRSVDLIREAAEYFLLDHFSVHVRSYFQAHDLEEAQLQTFERKDVPDVLLSNRFMELFTRPIDQRASFADSLKDSPENAILIKAWGTGGALYDRFELVLPAGASVARSQDNTIQIATRRVLLGFRADFEGTSAVLPRNFEQLALGIDDFLEVDAYKVVLNIQVSFRFSTLFTPTGWNYYHGLDSFLDSLADEFSQESYFARINWETALTLMTLQKGWPSRKEEHG